MTLVRWIQRSVPLATLALGATALPALAQYGQYGQNGQYNQGQELFEWNGHVDREVQLVMRGGNVQVERIGNTEPRGGRVRTFSQMPRTDGQLRIQVIEGRGNVDVIQQPSRQNGYTAIVRVEDPRSGSDTYRLAAYWQGYATSNGDVYGGGVNNRGRDRDRDGDDDRRDNRDNRGVYNGNGNGGYNNGTVGSSRYGYPQAKNALHWSGNVDGELEIRIQNGRVDYRNISGNQPSNIRADVGNLNMPRNNATVIAVQNQGRGTVSVIQQPSSWNGYTTVIRVRDPQGGYGFYDFNLMWQ